MISSIVSFLVLPTAVQSASALTRSSGCGKALAKGTKQGSTGSSNTVTLTYASPSRSFLLHVPTNYNVNDPRGLIFSFHGRGKTASQQETLSSFSDPYFNPNMLAAYPQGISNQWQGDPAATTDDITFTLKMIDYISQNYCINTDTIYATGKSNGGGFIASTLACNETARTKIAAFAASSGAYYQPTFADGSCNSETIPIICPAVTARPIPILEIHGDADDTIPFEGGPRRGMCLPSVDHFVKNWAGLNGLDSTSNITTSRYSGAVQQRSYGSAGLVSNYEVQGLTHAWASTLPNGDSGMPTVFNGTSVIMDFFGRYSLN